jgi:hypothetical protein
MDKTATPTHTASHHLQNLGEHPMLRTALLDFLFKKLDEEIR